MTFDQLKAEVTPKYKSLKFADWDNLIKLRGIDHKADDQLDKLVGMYVGKIPRLQELLVNGILDTMQGLQEKIDRLKEKFACVLKEKEFRERGLVSREIHRTVYYIDLTNGNDSRTGLKIGEYVIDSTADTTHFVDASLTGADDYINGSYVWNVTVGAGSLITDFVALTDTVTLTTPIVGMLADDTYYILDAWLTIQQYTSVTVRTDGDIAYVRANTTQTQTAAGIAFDEDATFLNPHYIIGCDATTNDPWNDDSDVRPIINFNDSAYGFVGNADDFWVIKRLDVRQSASSEGNFYFATCQGWLFNDCIFREASATTAYGFYAIGSAGKFTNCSFYSNKTYNCYMEASSEFIFESCNFDGGVDTTDYGIYPSQCVIYLHSCNFGVTTPHDLSSIYSSSASSFAYCRNCNFADATVFSTTSMSARLFSEDDDATKGKQYSYSRRFGTIIRDTSIEIDSLASAKMTPASTVERLGLTLSQGYMQDYAIWCPASATTITIKARETDAWTVDPTTAEFYFEASYLNHATNATRSTIASAQALSGVTEVSFTMTFTPSQAGWVYILCYLKKYEAAKSVNVSVKPAVS